MNVKHKCFIGIEKTIKDARLRISQSEVGDRDFESKEGVNGYDQN
jgi:hypothetical protein